MTLLVKGANAAAATTVTIPSHNVGDLIVIFALRRSNATAPSVPVASGTVPAWTTIDTETGSTDGAIVTAYFVATATNHTSGTWTNATDMIAAVISGQKASPIGGHATGIGNDAANSTAPAVTMSVTDGSSLLMYFHGHNATVSSWGSAPAGYTRRATGTMVVCNTKIDTTSDGSISQPVTSSVSVGYAAATVEILAAQGLPSFFALF